MHLFLFFCSGNGSNTKWFHYSTLVTRNDEQINARLVHMAQNACAKKNIEVATNHLKYQIPL